MKIALPQLSKDLEELSNLKALMESDETLSSLLVRNEDISHLRIKSFSASDMRLEKVDATETHTYEGFGSSKSAAKEAAAHAALAFVQGLKQTSEG